MDFEKKAELDRLIGKVDANRSYEKQLERDRQIQNRRLIHQYQDVKKTVLTPLLRDFMHKLQQGGHLSRLRDMGPTKLRFDMMLESAHKTAGLIEVELCEPDYEDVTISCLKNLSPVLVEKVPLEELDDEVLTDVLIRFMRILT
jgi:hypothetical protein